MTPIVVPPSGRQPSRLWVPIIRSWALTRGFALHPGTRNRYEIRDTRTQHRPPSRQVNDRGRVSGTHRPHRRIPKSRLTSPRQGFGHPHGVMNRGGWGFLTSGTYLRVVVGCLLGASALSWWASTWTDGGWKVLAWAGMVTSLCALAAVAAIAAAAIVRDHWPAARQTHAHGPPERPRCCQDPTASHPRNPSRLGEHRLGLARRRARQTGGLGEFTGAVKPGEVHICRIRFG